MNRFPFHRSKIKTTRNENPKKITLDCFFWLMYDERAWKSNTRSVYAMVTYEWCLKAWCRLILLVGLYFVLFFLSIALFDFIQYQLYSSHDIARIRIILIPLIETNTCMFFLLWTFFVFVFINLVHISGSPLAIAFRSRYEYSVYICIILSWYPSTTTIITKSILKWMKIHTEIVSECLMICASPIIWCTHLCMQVFFCDAMWFFD